MIPEQIINKQILKAPKQGTSYAEYWPDEADAALIVHAWNDLHGLVRAVDAALALAAEWDIPSPAENGSGRQDCANRLKAVIQEALLRCKDKIEDGSVTTSMLPGKIHTPIKDSGTLIALAAFTEEGTEMRWYRVPSVLTGTLGHTTIDISLCPFQFGGLYDRDTGVIIRALEE